MLHFNPLTFIIEQTCEVLIWKRAQDGGGLGLNWPAGALMAWDGLFWFQKARKGFADVF